MARRSPWMDERAQFLVKLLSDRHGLTITEDVAREDISNHVDLVAERMRIGRQAAKVYVTDDVIEELANRIGTYVRREQARPGGPRHLRLT
ncbi:hypothetical protein BH11ACT6_BH11ACT6_35080 [soil metagenome]